MMHLSAYFNMNTTFYVSFLSCLDFTFEFQESQSTVLTKMSAQIKVHNEIHVFYCLELVSMKGLIL